MPRRLLDLFPHLIVAVEVKHIGDEIERILIVLDLGVEASEVEAICQVVLVNLAKVLVSAGGDELSEIQSVSDTTEILIK